jgi:hypothetical protein
MPRECIATSIDLTREKTPAGAGWGPNGAFLRNSTCTFSFAPPWKRPDLVVAVGRPALEQGSALTQRRRVELPEALTARGVAGRM